MHGRAVLHARREAVRVAKLEHDRNECDHPDDERDHEQRDRGRPEAPAHPRRCERAARQREERDDDDLYDPGGHRTDCRLAERVVREPRVNPLSAVHKLRHAEIDDDARQRECLAALEPVLATHELEHAVEGERRRLVEILVEAERQPGLRRPRDRVGEPKIVPHRERELRALDRRLDRELRDLAVTLGGVPVTRREERSVDGDREVERRSGDELLAVDVPAARTRRRQSNECRARRAASR